MQHFTNYMTIMGTVTDIDLTNVCFELEAQSGDKFCCFVETSTDFLVLKNLDAIDRDRVSNPPDYDGSPTKRLEKYIRLNTLIAVEGIYQEHGVAQHRFDARRVHLLHSTTGLYLFEDTHWWLTQITRLADQWLDQLFGRTKRTYDIDDFGALYRTNLNITGSPSPHDDMQEMATLSRLIYGFSSAYLLTGAERYFLAARAGVQYQRETFRSQSHDGTYCFWAFGKREGELIMSSQNPDDLGTIPLYEQIYALAGLSQYYRITNEWEVLQDIRQTVQAINAFYLDEKNRGYFSHIDYVTMRPDVDALGDNKSRKNWNSIGDHLPAYLIDLILSLEPLPDNRMRDLGGFLEKCKWMLDETATLICEKFPDPDPNIPYVNERFYEDWSPDHHWRWQQNRAVVGHNLKIAWNLTRVANYYLAKGNPEKAKKLMNLAEKLGTSMEKFGLDRVRGGCFDAVEREPNNGMPVQFAWSNTKDFWQQEQGVLAYLILYGQTGNEIYLKLARIMAAFWNLFFLDLDHKGVYFRTTDNGLPIIEGQYGTKGSHSMSGYHAFELNYLAHIYIRTYLAKGGDYDDNFCLYFRPDKNSGLQSINVLPDFVAPRTLEVVRVEINGRSRASIDSDNFQIPLSESELGCEVAVEFQPRGRQATPIATPS